MLDASPAPKPSRPLDWPGEWGRDEKFWREVATRTVAGMLTIVLLGVPSLIYLMIAGQLEASVGIPIIIGIVMVILFVFIWSFVRWVVRFFERRRLRKIVRQSAIPSASEPTMNAERIALLVDQFLERRRQRGDPFGEDLEVAFTPRRADDGEAELSSEARSRMKQVVRASNILVPIVAFLASVIATFATGWFFR